MPEPTRIWPFWCPAVAFMRRVGGERRATRAADVAEHVWRRQADDDLASHRSGLEADLARLCSALVGAAADDWPAKEIRGQLLCRESHKPPEQTQGFRLRRRRRATHADYRPDPAVAASVAERRWTRRPTTTTTSATSATAADSLLVASTAPPRS